MSVNFTESDIKLLTCAWLCIEGGAGFPKIDYEKLAAQTGFTKASCGVMWNKLKRKVEAAAEGGEDGDGVPAATPKKTPKKRTAKEAGAITDGTPKKRGRPSKAAIAAAAAAKGEDSDDEDSKAVVKAEDDGVDKLLSGAKEFSAMDGAGLIGANSEDEV